MSRSSFSGWKSGSSRVPATRQSRGLEIVGLVFLFFYFWPLAFAYLTWKMLGYPVPTEMRGLMERAAGTVRDFRFGAGTPGFSTTGNLAFDEYRRAEIERLETERRRLDDDARAFRTFVDDLKRAKDREEFDAFIKRGRNGSNAA